MTNASGEQPVLDPTILSDMTGGSGDDLVTTLVEGFLEEADGRVAAIGAAVGSSNTDAAGFEAHALKSVSRTYGALRLGDVAAELEQAARDGDCATIKTVSAPLPDLWRETEAAFRARFLTGGGN